MEMKRPEKKAITRFGPHGLSTILCFLWFWVHRASFCLDSFNRAGVELPGTQTCHPRRRFQKRNPISNMNALQDKINKRQTLVVGVLLFDNHAQLDVFGPLELLTGINYKRNRAIELQTIALHGHGTTPVVVGPTPFTLTTVLAKDATPLDILLIPGGPGIEKIRNDPALVEMTRRIATQSTLVCTISQGSLLLASTSLLDGKDATTLKSVLAEQAQQQFPRVHWQSAPRWTAASSDQSIYTAAGVSAGMDMIYWMIGEWFGAPLQQEISNMAEYQPLQKEENQEKDPFWPPHNVNPPHKDLSSRPTLSVVFVLYDSFEMMDTFGPLEMFLTANTLARGNLLTITTVAETKQVKSVAGPSFRVDKTIAEVMKQDACAFDFVFIPGGIGTLREMHNPLMKTFLRKVVPQSKTVMTVCTGSNLLASTGLLDDCQATCNKLAFRDLTVHRKQVRWVEEARWVVAKGKKNGVSYYTSSGVSAGTDLALAVVGELYGVEFANAVAASVEYIRSEDANNDPFAHTIPPNTFLRKSLVHVQMYLLKAIYGGGLALGFPMYSLGPKVAGL